MERNAETPDVAPTSDHQPVLLPSALGRYVLHQAIPGTRSPELRTGGGCLVDYGNYNRSMRRVQKETELFVYRANQYRERAGATERTQNQVLTTNCHLSRLVQGVPREGYGCFLSFG